MPRVLIVEVVVAPGVTLKLVALKLVSGWGSIGGSTGALVVMCSSFLTNRPCMEYGVWSMDEGMKNIEY